MKPAPDESSSQPEPQHVDTRINRMERLTLRMSVIQTFIAVVSFVVAVAAVHAALSEAESARKQQQASVWPSLEVEYSIRTVPGSEELQIAVLNNGIGPAKVETIELFFDSKPLQNWQQFIRAFTDTEKPLFSYRSVSRRILRPESEYTVLSVTAAELGSATILAIQEAVKASRIQGRICYCSVYEDCWNLKIPSHDPQSVDMCPAASHDHEL